MVPKGADPAHEFVHCPGKGLALSGWSFSDSPACGPACRALGGLKVGSRYGQEMIMGGRRLGDLRPE